MVDLELLLHMACYKKNFSFLLHEKYFLSNLKKVIILTPLIVGFILQTFFKLRILSSP